MVRTFAEGEIISVQKGLERYRFKKSSKGKDKQGLGLGYA
jgi:hypothetical protein